MYWKHEEFRPNLGWGVIWGVKMKASVIKDCHRFLPAAKCTSVEWLHPVYYLMLSVQDCLCLSLPHLPSAFPCWMFLWRGCHDALHKSCNWTNCAGKCRLLRVNVNKSNILGHWPILLKCLYIITTKCLNYYILIKFLPSQCCEKQQQQQPHTQS